MVFLSTALDSCFILIILLQYSCAVFFDGNNGWCTELVPLRKTRTVWRNSHRRVERRNWIGIKSVHWEPYHYTATEVYDTYETRKKCCYMYTLLNGKCEPQCYPVCPQNSYCERPLICKCNSGYEPVNALETSVFINCRPICFRGCPKHSSCTQPNQCTCDTGFEGTTSCNPVCSKDCGPNSYCAAPDQCACNEGYVLNATLGEGCQPDCSEGCPVHGKCTAPNECTCENGYEGDDCHAVCSKGCASNSYCAAPEQCKCEKGFERKIGDEADGECEPICSKRCTVNSYCTAPEVCSCHDGFEMNNETVSCQPVCSLGCPTNSICIAPEVCACNAGYVMKQNDTLCEPVCAGSCPIHSRCATPGNCLCDDGYKKQKLTADQDYCEPICEQDCSTYGKCVRPGVCECLRGYEMVTNDAASPLCRPLCPRGCLHGFCFAPDICVCDPGYMMGPFDNCMPQCSMGCVNGECIDAEICSCLPGYQLQANSVNVCEPVCEPACEQADCRAPNICLCWNRYQPAENSSSICVPICPKECLNGYCNASFECSCNEGYVPHSYAPNECLPSCTNCQYGECLEPEVCQCWPGYVASKTIANDTEIVICTLETALQTTIESSTTTNTIPALDALSSSPAYDTASTSYLAHSLDALQLLVDYSQCQLRCKCWTEFDDMGILNTASCLKICADDFDQPCLDLAQCRCNLGKLELICNSTIIGEDDESSSEEEDLVLSCKIKQIWTTPKAQLTTTEGTNIQAEVKRKVHETKSKMPYWISAGVVGLTLMVILISLVVRHFTNKRNRNIIVSMQEDDCDL